MEQYLKDILEFAIDIHYYYDLSESKFNYINPALTENFGIKTEDAVGKDFNILLDIIHPEDRDLFEKHWNKLTLPENLYSKSSSCDIRCRIQSGRFLWFNDVHRYVRESNGKILYVIGCTRDITDFKVVEILKSTSKERLSMAMEAASDSIWEWKVTTNRLYFDARFYSILGFEPYEFPDTWQEWESRMHPADRLNASKLLHLCAIGESNQIHIEYRILTKENVWKWMLCRAKASGKNIDGKITRIIGTQTDISKLKEAEEEIKKHNEALREAKKTIQTNSKILQNLYNNLKENEERLKLFFNEAKNIAFIMFEPRDEELIFTEFSSGGENIFEISKDEVLQKSICEIFGKSLNKQFADLVSNLNKSNDEFKGEITLHKQNGNHVTCLLTIHFIVDEVNNQKKIIAIITDIQERKEFEVALRFKNEELIAAEEELKATNDELKFVNEEIHHRNIALRKINERLLESEEKFRELAENTNDAFWLRDGKNLLYINPSFEKVWGRSKDEIFENSQYLERWVHPEDRQRYLKKNDLDTFLNAKNYSEQFRIIKSDGSIRWLWSRIHPVFNGEGKIYRLAGIATDITEQKETENALIRAKEKAMESDKLKSSFLANISHEIRTPMNGILGFIELLNDDSLTQETRGQYTNIISKSSKQLLQIINDIIDISKIEANQVNIDVKECCINTTINDILLFYKKNKQVMEKGRLNLKVELPLAEKFAKIFTDESRLQQILMNLVDNAVKFTDEGEIVVGYQVLENKFIEFYIKDTGIGIQHDQYHRVFERFTQLDDSSTRRFGGTGLGLSISAGLAKLLGGSIRFESEVGKGTTFYLSIPYNPVNRRFIEPAIDIKQSYPNWENKIILIVEDDDINFELLKTILEPTRAIIIYAATGEEAIRIFTSNKDINLILMDIRLPGINGYQTMRIIKNHKPEIPVIAQTAFAMAEDNQICLEQGFDDYIAKPLNKKSLFEAIQKQLNW